MSPHDLACFEQWLEKFATAEERTLPYDKQLENHILWLSGVGDIETVLENIPDDSLGEAQ